MNKKIWKKNNKSAKSLLQHNNKSWIRLRLCVRFCSFFVFSNSFYLWATEVSLPCSFLFLVFFDSFTKYMCGLYVALQNDGDNNKKEVPTPPKTNNNQIKYLQQKPKMRSFFGSVCFRFQSCTFSSLLDSNENNNNNITHNRLLSSSAKTRTKNSNKNFPQNRFG